MLQLKKKLAVPFLLNSTYVHTTEQYLLIFSLAKVDVLVNVWFKVDTLHW